MNYFFTWQEYYDLIKYSVDSHKENKAYVKEIIDILKVKYPKNKKALKAITRLEKYL